jgi:hypothetical protein
MLKPLEYLINEQGCWINTSHSRNSAGYPIIHRAGRCWTMHKWFYQQKFGPLPKNTVLRHTCDNKECFNPDHGLPGTHQQNVQDRVDRGRSAHGPHNGRTKLTEAQVLAAYHSREDPKVVARRYGVDPKLIRQIRAGVIWRYLTAPLRSPRAA